MASKKGLTGLRLWQQIAVLFGMLFIGFTFGTLFGHSMLRPKTKSFERRAIKDGCEIYPNDPVCKMKEAITGREDCFVPRGSKAPEYGELGIPFECRKLGPLGLLDIEDLRGEWTSDFKAITEIPPSIKPYYEKANAQLSMKSSLFTFMVIMKANGDNGEDAMKDPSLAPLVQELSLSSDDGLTEEERKTVGQILSVYNAFSTLLSKQRLEERQKVAKECADYTNKALVPIRCAVVNSPPATAPAKTL